jgi:hypothetical protein
VMIRCGSSGSLSLAWLLPSRASFQSLATV